MLHVTLCATFIPKKRISKMATGGLLEIPNHNEYPFGHEHQFCEPGDDCICMRTLLFTESQCEQNEAENQLSIGDNRATYRESLNNWSAKSETSNRSLFHYSDHDCFSGTGCTNDVGTRIIFLQNVQNEQNQLCEPNDSFHSLPKHFHIMSQHRTPFMQRNTSTMPQGTINNLSDTWATSCRTHSLQSLRGKESTISNCQSTQPTVSDPVLSTARKRQNPGQSMYTSRTSTDDNVEEHHGKQSTDEQNLSLTKYLPRCIEPTGPPQNLKESGNNAWTESHDTWSDSESELSRHMFCEPGDNCSCMDKSVFAVATDKTVMKQSTKVPSEQKLVGAEYIGALADNQHEETTPVPTISRPYRERHEFCEPGDSCSCMDRPISDTGYPNTVSFEHSSWSGHEERNIWPSQGPCMDSSVMHSSEDRLVLDNERHLFCEPGDNCPCMERRIYFMDTSADPRPAVHESLHSLHTDLHHSGRPSPKKLIQGINQVTQDLLLDYRDFNRLKEMENVFDMSSTDDGSYTYQTGNKYKGVGNVVSQYGTLCQKELTTHLKTDFSLGITEEAILSYVLLKMAKLGIEGKKVSKFNNFLNIDELDLQGKFHNNNCSSIKSGVSSIPQ